MQYFCGPLHHGIPHAPIAVGWREAQDSNLRTAFTINGLANRRHKPLGQPPRLPVFPDSQRIPTAHSYIPADVFGVNGRIRTCGPFGLLISNQALSTNSATFTQRRMEDLNPRSFRPTIFKTAVINHSTNPA